MSERPDVAEAWSSDQRGGGASGWQPIETAPRDGTEIELNHSLSAPAYACKGRWSDEDGCWIVPNFFISTSMQMFRQPNVWRPAALPGGQP